MRNFPPRSRCDHNRRHYYQQSCDARTFAFSGLLLVSLLESSTVPDKMQLLSCCYHQLFRCVMEIPSLTLDEGKPFVVDVFVNCMVLPKNRGVMQES